MDHRVRASKLWKMNGGIQGWILGKDSLLKIDRFQSRALFHRVPGVSGRGTLIDTRGDTITKFYSPSNIRGGEYILSSKPIKISKCAKQISLSRLNIVHAFYYYLLHALTIFAIRYFTSISVRSIRMFITICISSPLHVISIKTLPRREIKISIQKSWTTFRRIFLESIRNEKSWNRSFTFSNSRDKMKTWLYFINIRRFNIIFPRLEISTTRLPTSDCADGTISITRLDRQSAKGKRIVEI